MLRRFLRFLYGDVPARFASDFSVSESVTRLRANTKRSVFSSLLRQRAVGRVTNSEVRLQRVIPFFGNSFKPVFVGSFSDKHGRVVLEGRFTMFRSTKIFMTLWFSFFLVWTALAVYNLMRRAAEDTGDLIWEPMKLLFPFAGFAFIGVGVIFVRFGWWLSRGDMKFLSALIRRALSREMPNLED